MKTRRWWLLLCCRALGQMSLSDVPYSGEHVDHAGEASVGVSADVPVDLPGGTYISHASNHETMEVPHAAYHAHVTVGLPEASYHSHEAVEVPHASYHTHETVGLPEASYHSHEAVEVPHASYHSHPSVNIPHATYHDHASDNADGPVGMPHAAYHDVVPHVELPDPIHVPESAYHANHGQVYQGRRSRKFGSLYHECEGHEEQWSSCDDLPECVRCVPTDCLFSEWSEWFPGTGCAGLMFRHRSIQAENNQCGLPCYGDKIQSKEKPFSDDDGCIVPSVDCEMTEWGEWSHCLNEKDQSIRSRCVAQSPERSGNPCAGALAETRPCGGPHPHPCQLSEWQPWTTCSASCGPGRYTRLRKILTEGHLNGQTCEDSLLETQTCSLTECPIRDCQISAWSDWSFCGAGGSQRMRHRRVLQSPKGPGMYCKAALVETAGCTAKDPDTCQVSEWTEWSICDRTCHGGQKYRQRELLHVASSSRSFCKEVYLKEAAPCATAPCVPHSHDCQLSHWTAWSTCSAAVGNGLAYRNRVIVSPAGAQGTGCFGLTKEVQPCQMAPPEAVDCVWGGWSHWSACSCSCGGGTKRRSRAIDLAPQSGGASCEPQEKEVIVACNTHRCEEHCEDGLWSAWLPWSKCSSTCSNGYRSRRRSMDVLPNACGHLPAGDREEFELCENMPSCSADSDCALSEWQHWSECSCSCNGIRERNRHISAYSRGQGRPCDDLPLKVIEHCNPSEGGRPPYGCNQRPQDCVMGEWEGWSKCSATCGVGQQKRERKVLQISQAGGRPCVGDMSMTRECSVQRCYAPGVEDCQLSPWSNWGSCSHCGGQRWRQRNIQTLPNYKGRPCEDYTLKQVSNCTSTCHKTRLCAWSEWSQMDCSQQCGDPSSLRSRTLQLLPPGVLGSQYFFSGDQKSHCFGSQITVAECDASGCGSSCVPVHCSFHQWSEWTEPSCVGLCERQRVIAQMNNECGQPCNGSLLETRHCQTTCGHAVDCKISEWTMWSHCTNLTHTAVRGQRYRKREVISKPQRGGLACSGDLVQTRACASEMPEPCVFAMWESWSICSARCGEGTRWRTRKIHQQAEDGGQQCHGNIEEVEACHAFHADCASNVRRDCVLGDWRPWGPCDYEDQRERRRSIVAEAQGGGEPCYASLQEIESCRESKDCVVTEWTEWDACSRSCGSGHTKRQRQISRFPSLGGALCPEDLLQLKSCALEPCKANDCQVSEWLQWGACSATCGGGHQSRTREVVSTREPGGLGCYFSLAQDRACHDQMCDEGCEWGSWREWSECSKTCGGGFRQRSRVLLSIPMGGQSLCDEKAMSEVEPCAVDQCGELCIDGAWGEWDRWSECSASCDGGEMFRHRDMARMANYCGNPAIGFSKETRFCNVDVPCQGPRDCSFGPWTSWIDCSSSCEGVTTRRREVEQFGQAGGSFCRGPLKEVAPCYPASDQGEEGQCEKGPPVDCELTTWAAWSACSASCGGGESRRSRTVRQEAYDGGFGCQEPLEEILECARDPCEEAHLPVDCVMGEWRPWGACNACGGERSRRRSIVIYAKNGGRACPAADMIEVKECPHDCDTQFTCAWASWESWSECTMSCGAGGQRKRIRHMVQLPSMADYSQYGLTANDYQSLERGEDMHVEVHHVHHVHHVHVNTEHHWQVLQKKYQDLHRKSQLLEGQHGQEVLIAFGTGALCMFALLPWVFRLQTRASRVLSREDLSRQDHDPEWDAWTSDAEAALIAREH